MARGRNKQILDHLAPSEHRPVLRALLDAHPDLRDEAEQLATSQLTDVDREVVAGAVTDAYLDQSFMDINSRAGRQPYGGYVHPADAQWELLEEVLEPFLNEIGRLARLGFAAAATEQANGVLIGLAELERTAGEDTLIGWGSLEDHVHELGESVRDACRRSGVDHGQLLDARSAFEEAVSAR